jgi:hypothetical protein
MNLTYMEDIYEIICFDGTHCVLATYAGIAVEEWLMVSFMACASASSLQQTNIDDFSSCKQIAQSPAELALPVADSMSPASL